jgi:hypothetical protein
VTTAGLLPGNDIVAVLDAKGPDALDLVLVPGEAINDDDLFIDNLSLDVLRSRVGFPIVLSKDFVDALP